jgi:hypothetical protein
VRFPRRGGCDGLCPRDCAHLYAGKSARGVINVVERCGLVGEQPRRIADAAMSHHEVNMAGVEVNVDAG